MNRIYFQESTCSCSGDLWITSQSSTNCTC
uniref:Uncharacterized protein n=1 Tax=Myoviridae sp. ct0mD26 TaxID=2825015 RepID=A0A8S5UEN8_9CAUD|nr:MAG TPA: hypothetical protein [Myoviridae sp. ct0mD26]